MTLNAMVLVLERRCYVALRMRADRRSKLPPHLMTGERGEDAAFFYLRGLGYTVVARRWRAERVKGDLDIVAWDGTTLVFFEVKARTARDIVPAEGAVDSYKQKTLRAMAAAYLKQLPDEHRGSVGVRFDVVSVYLLATGTEFEHFANAFPFREPSRWE